MRALAAVLPDYITRQGFKVRIVGHTDSQGDAYYNQTLSERRAWRVKAALVEYYPQLGSALFTEGRGESQLRHQGWSPAIHALNRRVEIELFH